MANTQPQIKDIFTFDPEYQYTFFLINQLILLDMLLTHEIMELS